MSLPALFFPSPCLPLPFILIFIVPHFNLPLWFLILNHSFFLSADFLFYFIAFVSTSLPCLFAIFSFLICLFYHCSWFLFFFKNLWVFLVNLGAFFCCCCLWICVCVSVLFNGYSSWQISLISCLSPRSRVICLLWWYQCFLTTSGLWLQLPQHSKASFSHQACPISQV